MNVTQAVQDWLDKIDVGALPPREHWPVETLDLPQACKICEMNMHNQVRAVTRILGVRTHVHCAEWFATSRTVTGATLEREYVFTTQRMWVVQHQAHPNVPHVSIYVPGNRDTMRYGWYQL